jgi:hypothetical protein
MRWVLLFLLMLSACVAPRDRPPSQPPPRPAESPAAFRQCLADLGKAGARFEILPDRYFGGGCSATGAVKLVAIGIPVTNLGALKCRTAERLARWTNEAVQTAAMAWLDARVVKIESFGTYACRPVNSVSGARLSEHATANAVDIAAFVLADGRRITVEKGWRGPDENARNFLRAVHKAACRRFSVVIGPDGDAQHYNHFHFDMGARGPYCR